MASEQQEISANGIDMNQQITEAIQPVMEDLQNQITNTVQEQLGGGSSGSSLPGLDSLGDLGETLQTSLNEAMEQLKPFFQWLMEKVQQLISWVVSLFIGGGSSEEAESSEGEEETEEAESEEAEAQPA